MMAGCYSCLNFFCYNIFFIHKTLTLIFSDFLPVSQNFISHSQAVRQHSERHGRNEEAAPLRASRPRFARQGRAGGGHLRHLPVRQALARLRRPHLQQNFKPAQR